jgi:hypothetical protein
MTNIFQFESILIGYETLITNFQLLWITDATLKLGRFEKP